MIFNSPLGIQKADQIIDILGLSSLESVVDIGCGTGEFLIRVVERWEVNGLGIDQEEGSIAAAKLATSGRVPDERCAFRQGRIQDISLGDDSFGLAICNGSTHAYGSGPAAYPNAIREMRRVVKPGGLMLIGEGYWKQDPEPEYLDLIGEPVGIYHNHSANIEFGEEQGLIPLCALVSSDDEWDLFEWSHQNRIERAFAASPEDTALAQRLQRRREWMKGYLRWGRNTMGFGFYLFQRPAR